MRDRQAFHNRLMASANTAERAINQEQRPDTWFPIELGDMLNIGPKTEKSKARQGTRGSDALYVFGNDGSINLNFEQAQPQHLAFLAAFGMGNVTTVENVGGTVYTHTIKHLDADHDARRSLPTATLVELLGSSIMKQCAASFSTNSMTLSVSQNAFLKITGSMKGTGKRQINTLVHEETGTNGDTTVDLAGKVEGADAAARLDAVHSVDFKLDSGGGYAPVHFTAVSDADPAVVSITAPTSGGTDAGTYRVVYIPDEDTAQETGTLTSAPSWDPFNEISTLTDTVLAMTPDEHIGKWVVMTGGAASGAIFKISDNTATEIMCAGYDVVSAGVANGDGYVVRQFGWLPADQAQVSETPLRIEQIQAVVGGYFNGTTYSGGRAVGPDLKSLEIGLNNNLSANYLAGDVDAAGELVTGDVSWTCKITRRMADALYQALMQQRDADNDTEADYFALKVSGEGAVISGGYTFYFELVLPKVARASAAPALDDKRINEAVELAVLEHETHGFAVITVRNGVSSYAA